MVAKLLGTSAGCIVGGGAITLLVEEYGPMIAEWFTENFGVFMDIASEYTEQAFDTLTTLM